MHSCNSIATFLFQNPKNYVLFPSNPLRDNFIEQTAHLLGACTTNQYIVFNELQTLLCHEISYILQKPLRILTFAERIYMYELFLSKPSIQNAIINLENCTHDNPTLSDLTHHGYLSKFERILQNYALINSLQTSENKHAHKIYRIIQFIAKKYYEFITHHKCIDYAAATLMLYENNDEKLSSVSTHNFDRMLIINKDFFSIPQQLWFAQWEKQFPLSLIDEIPTTSQNARKTQDDYDKETKNTVYKTQHIFSNIVQELNWAFGTIFELHQKQHVPLHDIGITISNINDFVITELQSLSQKYNIDINLQYTKNISTMALLNEFVHSLTESLEYSMNPDILKKLFLLPSVPWKHRDYNIEIIKLGIKYHCIDDKEMYRWKYALRSYKNTALEEYFFSLYQSLHEICFAKTYTQLREAFLTFVDTFIHTNSKKNEKITGYVIQRTIDIIDEITVQEQFINDVSKSKHFTWRTVCAVASRRSTLFKKTSGVRIYEFPHSLNIHHQHHFFLNTAEDDIKRASAPPMLLGDFIDTHIFLDTTQSHIKNLQEKYQNAISNGGLHVYHTASKEDFSHIRSIPIDSCTNNKNLESDKTDIFYNEQELWNSTLTENAFDALTLTPQQWKGLESQNNTIHFSQKDNIQNLHDSTIQIIRKNVDAHTLRTSNVTELMSDPFYYLLQYVFKIHPLFENFTKDFQVAQEFGTIFHDIFSIIISHKTISSTEIKTVITNKIETLQAHYLIKKTLISIFQNDEIQNFIFEVHSFIKKEFFDERNYLSPKTEETMEMLFQNIFTWATVCPSLMIKGRVDLLLENKENNAYIIDYKRKKRSSSLEYFVQTWIYHIIHTHKIEENIADKMGIFFIVPNIQKAHDEKPLTLSTPNQKEIPFITKYETLLKYSFFQLLHDYKAIKNMSTLDDETLSLRDTLRQHIYKHAHYKFIEREGCYIYQPKLK